MPMCMPSAQLWPALVACTCFLGLVLGPAAAAAFKLPTVPTVALSNGVVMPLLIMGTGNCPESPTDAKCVDGVRDAVALSLQLGFTGIDTANHYHNQLGVAAGIALAKKTSAAPVWVTSKIEACNNSFVRWGHCAEDTKAVFARNLAELGAKSVDLMLLHAPTSTGGTGGSVYPGLGHTPPCNCSAPAACTAMQQQWGVLEEYYAQGKARAIGVSNYCVNCLNCLRQTAKVTPMVNQIRIHVGMDVLSPSRIEQSLITECLRQNIVPQAYSPLGSGSNKVLAAEETIAIGKSHNVSSAQVALRWLVQHNIPSVTACKAAEGNYMAEDLAVFSFNLTKEEERSLDGGSFANETMTKIMCISEH